MSKRNVCHYNPSSPALIILTTEHQPLLYAGNNPAILTLQKNCKPHANDSFLSASVCTTQLVVASFYSGFSRSPACFHQDPPVPHLVFFLRSAVFSVFSCAFSWISTGFTSISTRSGHLFPADQWSGSFRSHKTPAGFPPPGPRRACSDRSFLPRAAPVAGGVCRFFEFFQTFKLSNFFSTF